MICRADLRALLRLRAGVYVYVCVCMFWCVCVCMCVCVCVHVYTRTPPPPPPPPPPTHTHTNVHVYAGRREAKATRERQAPAKRAQKARGPALARKPRAEAGVLLTPGPRLPSINHSNISSNICSSRGWVLLTRLGMGATRGRGRLRTTCTQGDTSRLCRDWPRWVGRRWDTWAADRSMDPTCTTLAQEV